MSENTKIEWADHTRNYREGTVSDGSPIKQHDRWERDQIMRDSLREGN